MINESIRYLREQLGLTQAQLAHKIGMKTPQLCVIEKGRYNTQPKTLARIVRALGTTEAELAELGETLENPSPLVPLFASSAGLTAERTRAERTSERIDERVNALGIVGATTLPFVQSFVRERHAGVFLAQAMRSALGVGRSAFADLVWNLELANVRILLDSLPEGVSSLAWWHAERQSLLISLSRKDTPERQLYRLACELGAACLFRSGGDRPLRSAKKDDRTISEFAADFLMPSTTVAEMTSQLGIGKADWTLSRLCLFKAHFGVSAEAFAFRLEELGLIDRQLRLALRSELRAYYRAHPKAMEPAPARPTLAIGRRWEAVAGESAKKQARRTGLQS